MELPHTFGKYELVQLLGEGGMASVYRAAMSGPGGFRKQVALKLLKRQVSEVEQMVELLFNEARLGGLLQHNNVVEVYEFDKIDGQYYMAIEFVDGYTLSEVMARVPIGQGMPPKIVAKIAVQICQGLAYAHAAVDDQGQPMNLVHRDLKPANVMIRRDGVIKIADFGIAKAATNLSETQTGLTRGTPVYMSPEQAVGASDRPIDRRSDLFSLASVLCEAITGELVFGAPQMLQVLNKVAAADVQMALDRVTELAPAMVPVLERAWNHDRDDRYADAVEMGKHIHAVYDDLPGPAPHLASWLAAWMDVPEPSTIDQEIDSLTSAEVVGAPPLRPTEPAGAGEPDETDEPGEPAEPSPPPDPTPHTKPIQGARKPPARQEPDELPAAARLSVSMDDEPSAQGASIPPVNLPLVSPEKAAVRAITQEEPPPPRPSPKGIRPGRLTSASKPQRKKRSGFRFEHGVLVFAFVGLLFAVVFLSANDWKIPGLSDDGPPELLDPDRTETVEDATAEPGRASPRTPAPETVHAETVHAETPPQPPPPVDLGLAEDIDGNARVKRCINKHLRKNDTFAPVEVRYTVAEDGSVDSVALTAPKAVDAELGECLVAGMEKLKFRGLDLDGPTAQLHVFWHTP